MTQEDPWANEPLIQRFESDYRYNLGPLADGLNVRGMAEHAVKAGMTDPMATTPAQFQALMYLAHKDGQPNLKGAHHA